MKCEQIQPNLLDYSRGTLPNSEAAEIRIHLKTCEDCSTVLKEELALDAVFKNAPTEQPASDIWGIVESRISVSRPGILQTLRSMVSNRAFRTTSAIAVTAALLAIITIQFKPESTTQSVVSSPPLTAVSMNIKWTDDPAGDNSDAMLKYIENM